MQNDPEAEGTRRRRRTHERGTVEGRVKAVGEHGAPRHGAVK